MNEFVHQRHKPPSELDRARELVLAVPQLRSNVNLARILRTAGCCGVNRVITSSNQRIDAKVARDSLEHITVERRRSLAPVLRELSSEGYSIVGLEQSSGSRNLHEFEFDRRSVLVIGHERDGIREELLGNLDQVVEIPVYGMPYSYNVATATSMALYEYCRQFPRG